MNKDYKLYVHIAPNGKKYYGITMQKPERRWANGKGYKNNEYFTRAINKYGWDNIEHIVLHEGLDEDEAKELEQYMIQWNCTANPNYGYNISLGGESNNFSEATKKKISEARKGKPLSEETKKRISEANKGKNAGEKHPQYGKFGNEAPMYGKHHTEETKKRISESLKGEKHPNYGKHFSEEHRQKLREANVGKQMGKDNAVAKSIICITTNRVFDTLREGAKYYNTDDSSIAKCCRGKRNCCGSLSDGTKLVWKYIDIIEL